VVFVSGCVDQPGDPKSEASSKNSSANPAISASISSPTPAIGDSAATFTFSVTYSNAQLHISKGELELAASALSVITTGDVSCGTPSIFGGTTATPSITLSNCTGNGTASLSIQATIGASKNVISSVSPTAKIFTCPAGYIKAPGNSNYSTDTFCVMKYEAKDDGNGSPISQANSMPMTNISKNSAVIKCQGLGHGYDLMTNAEWQTVAQNVEMVNSNWSGGTVGTGCLKAGNSHYNSSQPNCGYYVGAMEQGTGRSSLSELALNNGQTIWDLAGNAWEWVKEDNSHAYDYDYLMALVTEADGTPGPLGSVKHAFGPAGDYTYAGNNTWYAGLGLSSTWASFGAIARGGHYGGVNESGVFAATTTLYADRTYAAVGFRCVYHP
jgi:formylglycine-generating enzyme required for sulfatase activity